MYKLNHDVIRWFVDSFVGNDVSVVEQDGRVLLVPDEVRDENGAFDEDNAYVIAERIADNKVVEQETPLGTLVAEVSSDPSYPGIWVSIRDTGPEGDGCENELALIEVCDNDADTNVPVGEKRIVTRVYGDLDGDEYTDRVEHYHGGGDSEL